MGLLLSILVACVGVVELLAFYWNVTRSFVTTSTQTSLSDINKRYLQDLDKHKSATNHVSVLNNKYKESVVCSTTLTSANSSEDIELEFDTCLVRSKARSPSPRRFLLTEKENESRSKSPSPRRFLVSSDKPDDTTKDLRQFVVESKSTTSTGEGTSQTQFVIRDEQNKVERTFPLPKQFVVTELESEDVQNATLERSRSQSPIHKRLGEQETVFRRSPSPYPSLVLSVPRNSICSELLDNPLRVDEVDEESLSKSPTPENVDRILGVPSTKMNSHSPECSKNSKQPVHFESNDVDDDVKEYDNKFLDSLDGVKRKKMCRSSSSRKSRKKRSSTDCAVVSNEMKDDCLSSSSSLQHNESQTAKTLTEAANVLKNVNPEADDGSAKPGTSKDGDSNMAEPFWVNRKMC